MQIRIAVLTLLTSVALTACGSVRVFELPKVQSHFSETLQKSEGIAQKAQNDFTGKKMLVDNLSKSASPQFKQNESELRKKLNAMDEALQEVVVQKKIMSEANGELASLSYSRDKVHSNESEFPKVEEAVRRFENAAGEMNAAMVDYSRESNSMADLIAQKKLYFNFDVAEFQKRVQKNISITQENQRIMQRELTRSENVLNNWNKATSRREQEEIFTEMRDAGHEYSARANRFAEINREVNGATMGKAWVSTLDPEWPEVQKLVSEFDLTVSELAKLYEKFQSKVDLFRNPAKRVR